MVIFFTSYVTVNYQRIYASLRRLLHGKAMSPTSRLAVVEPSHTAHADLCAAFKPWEIRRAPTWDVQT